MKQPNILFAFADDWGRHASANAAAPRRRRRGLDDPATPPPSYGALVGQECPTYHEDIRQYV